MSSWDWEEFDEEEGVIDRLLLFLWECLDLFEFFFRREELKESDLEVEIEEEDDRCLLLFLDLCSLFDWSFLEGLEIDKSFEFGGSIITLGSETCEKSGSSGIICLEEEAGLGSSSLLERS